MTQIYGRHESRHEQEIKFYGPHRRQWGLPTGMGLWIREEEHNSYDSPDIKSDIPLLQFQIGENAGTKMKCVMLEHFCIAQCQRNTGIGSKLFADLCEMWKKQGVQYIILRAERMGSWYWIERGARLYQMYDEAKHSFEGIDKNNSVALSNYALLSLQRNLHNKKITDGIELFNSLAGIPIKISEINLGPRKIDPSVVPDELSLMLNLPAFKECEKIDYASWSSPPLHQIYSDLVEEWGKENTRTFFEEASWSGYIPLA